MAYGTKYNLVYDVLESPSKDLVSYRLTFELDGYTGAMIPLLYGGASPVIAKIRNSQDSTIGIKEKQLHIEVLEDIDLSELQRAKPKEWKVTHYKTIGNTTTVDFKGWLVPTNNGTEYVDGKKYVRLEANDGLEFLKNTDFVDDSGKYYDGLVSVFDLIKLCLSKTGLGLKLNTINNTYAVGNAQNDSDDALKQRYVDIDLFRGESEPLIAYNVLGQILKTEKCRISQEDGEWWFEHTTEKRTGFVKARKYEADGSFISGGTLNLRVSALHNSNFQPMAGGEVSSIPANKWVKITHKLGKFKNRLLNKDFANLTSGDFSNWFKTHDDLIISRVGDGTSSNPYGPKLLGYASKPKNSAFLYQNIVIGTNSIPALTDEVSGFINRNIVFSGNAFTEDVESAFVRCVVEIITIDAGVGYFGLSDAGEWVSPTSDILLKNSDINNKSKKSPVSWNITSKKLSEIVFYNRVTGRMVDWQNRLAQISIKVYLGQGVKQLSPPDGEIQNSYVSYNHVSLSWINADTNRNLKDINYKATQIDYAPNNESFDAAYGDYVDSSNLSALRYADGSLTKLWISESDNAPKNFHLLGVADLLDETGGTPKVYDGTIWGLLKYRHSVELAGFTNRGYIVSYSYDYASSMADVRIIEHQDTADITAKKTGVLSDNTEIDMPDDSPPSPVMGNGVGGGSVGSGGVNISSWLQQILSGVQGVTSEEEVIDIVWDGIATNDAFDFGSIVRRNDKLLVGDAYDELSLGNKDNETLVDVLGGRIKIGENLLYDKSITDGEGDIIKQLGIDADFQVDGRIEAVSGISVGQDGILITKEFEDGKIYGKVDAENELRFVAPEVNVTNTLGVNELSGIDNNPIVATSPIYFNQPIYVQQSTNPNSPITNAQFDVALSAYDFGNIRIYPPVRAVSNLSNITLFGEYMLDSVNLVDGYKVLVKDQTDARENGIYIVKANANWERVTDLPNGTIKGVQVQVVDGSLINQGGIFVNTNTTEVTVGVTEITFRQSYQNVLNVYAASLAENNQIFFGTNKFINKLEVRTPLSGTEAANMDFVNSKVSELSTIITNNYWAKINNYGIGTTTNNALEFYANNIKQAQLNGRNLTGLRGIHINDGVYTPPFATTFPTYYGFTVRDNVHVGSLGGTSKALYSLDLVRGSSTGNRSGVRFGSYLSFGGVSQFFYGIEYSTSDKLSIGRYTTSFMDGTTTGLDTTKSITMISSGFVGFGLDTPTERVDIFGNLKVSGVYKPSGNAPASGNMFLVSDGTTANKYMNFGEFGQFQTHEQYGNISSLPWGASFVNGTDTDLPNDGLQAHVFKMSIGSEYSDQATYLAIPRPFGNYFDGQIYVRGVYGGADSGWISVGGNSFKDYDFDENEATIQYHGYFFNNTPDGREGFIGFNRLDGGVVLEYKYTEIDSNVTTTYRNFMNSDGRLYLQINNGEAKRYALLEEVGSGGSGVTYSPIEPIYFSGTQIGVRTASASQIGVLTANDWNIFNSKLDDGATINNKFNFAPLKHLYFGYVSNSVYDARIYHNPNNTSWNFQTDNSHIYIGTFGTAKNVELTADDGDIKLIGNKIFLNGIELNMTKVASMIGV